MDPGNLPPKEARMLQHVYDSARLRWIKDGKSVRKAEEIAARQAWTEVKRHYYRKGGRWHKRRQPLAHGEYPPGSKAANPRLTGKGPYKVVVGERTIGKITRVGNRFEGRTVALIGHSPKTVVEFHPTKEAARDAIAAHHTRTTARNRIQAEVKRNTTLSRSLASANDLEAIRRVMK